MNQFCLRITDKFLKDKNKTSLFNTLDKKCNKILVCEETAENLHYHFMLETSYTQKTIRENIKKYLVKCGNESYSLSNANGKNKTYKGGLQYTCKGELEGELPSIVHFKGYTQNDIKRFHKNYWLENNRLKKNKKNKGLPYFCVLFERLCIDDLHLLDHMQDIVKKEDILKSLPLVKQFVIKHYIKDCKTFPTSQALDNIVNSLYAKMLVKVGYDLDRVAEIMIPIIEDRPWNHESEYETHTIFYNKNKILF